MKPNSAKLIDKAMWYIFLGWSLWITATVIDGWLRL